MLSAGGSDSAVRNCFWSFTAPYHQSQVFHTPDTVSPVIIEANSQYRPHKIAVSPAVSTPAEKTQPVSEEELIEGSVNVFK